MRLLALIDDLNFYSNLVLEVLVIQKFSALRTRYYDRVLEFGYELWFVLGLGLGLSL